MQFAAICPTNYLHLTSGLKYHMCLAQHLDGVSDYYKFFHQKAREPGNTVIMDNGAYEGSRVHENTLLRLVTEVQPQVVVLPDWPGDGVKTVEMSMKFFQRLLDVKWEGKVMGVVHAPDGDLPQFCRTYMKLLTFCRWIGFSRLTKSYGVVGEHTKLRRVQFVHELQRKGLWSKFHKYHALGMLDGQTKELSLLAKEGFEGCDSSAPIWRGLWGWKMSDKGWDDVPFSPIGEAMHFKGNEHIAASNLKRVLAACEGKVVRSVA